MWKTLFSEISRNFNHKMSKTPSLESTNNSVTIVEKLLEDLISEAVNSVKIDSCQSFEDQLNVLHPTQSNSKSQNIFFLNIMIDFKKKLEFLNDPFLQTIGEPIKKLLVTIIIFCHMCSSWPWWSIYWCCSQSHCKFTTKGNRCNNHIYMCTHTLTRWSRSKHRVSHHIYQN